MQSLHAMYRRSTSPAPQQGQLCQNRHLIRLAIKQFHLHNEKSRTACRVCTLNSASCLSSTKTLRSAGVKHDQASFNWQVQIVSCATGSGPFTFMCEVLQPLCHPSLFKQQHAGIACHNRSARPYACWMHPTMPLIGAPGSLSAARALHTSVLSSAMHVHQVQSSAIGHLGWCMWT